MKTKTNTDFIPYSNTIQIIEPNDRGHTIFTIGRSYSFLQKAVTQTHKYGIINGRSFGNNFFCLNDRLASYTYVKNYGTIKQISCTKFYFVLTLRTGTTLLLTSALFFSRSLGKLFIILSFWISTPEL